MKKVLFLFAALMALSFTSQAQLLANFGTTNGKYGCIKIGAAGPGSAVCPADQAPFKVSLDAKTQKLKIEFDGGRMDAKTITSAFAGNKIYIAKDLMIPDQLCKSLNAPSCLIKAGTYALTVTGKIYSFMQQ